MEYCINQVNLPYSVHKYVFATYELVEADGYILSTSAVNTSELGFIN